MLSGICQRRGYSRHSFHPYVLGAPRAYSEKDLAELDAKNIEYNGVKMTEYEASQKQRYIERQIRAQKRKAAALEAAGLDSGDVRAALRKTQKTYTDFCRQTGLKRQSARTQTAAGSQTARTAQKNAANGLNGAAKSGIMNMQRNLPRKEANQGSFSNLKIPMQKRAVKQIAAKYSIDLTKLTIKIQRSESLIGLPIAGAADGKQIGRIDLFPNAFIDDEQLIKTILHEKCHVEQYKKYGYEYVYQHMAEMEAEARQAEMIWDNIKP